MDSVKYNLILAEFACKYVEAIMSKGPGSCNQNFSLVKRINRSGLPTPASKLPEPQFPPQPVPKGGIWNAASDAWNELMYQREVTSLKDEHAQKSAAYGNELNSRVTKLKKETKQAIDAQRDDLVARGLIASGSILAIAAGKRIEAIGLGNCGEQSYVAFKYLVTKRASGLAIMDWGPATDTSIKMQTDNKKVQTGNHMFVVIGMDETVPKETYGSLSRPPNWGANAVVCDPWFHEWFPLLGGDRLWQRKMQQILSATIPLTPKVFQQMRLQAPNEKLLPENQQNAHIVEAGKLFETKWTFIRDVYLAYPRTYHVKFACEVMSGNKLKTWDDSRNQLRSLLGHGTH